MRLERIKGNVCCTSHKRRACKYSTVHRCTDWASICILNRSKTCIVVAVLNAHSCITASLAVCCPTRSVVTANKTSPVKQCGFIKVPFPTLLLSSNRNETESAKKFRSNTGTFLDGKWYCDCPDSPEAEYHMAGPGTKNAGKWCMS
jgi:hypothetical protein